MSKTDGAKKDPNEVTMPEPGKIFECAHCYRDITGFHIFTKKPIADGGGYECPSCKGQTCRRCAGGWC